MIFHHGATTAEETAIYFRHHGNAGVLSADFEVRWTNLSSSQLTCTITINPTLINVGGCNIVLSILNFASVHDYLSSMEVITTY